MAPCIFSGIRMDKYPLKKVGYLVLIAIFFISYFQAISLVSSFFFLVRKNMPQILLTKNPFCLKLAKIGMM